MGLPPPPSARCPSARKGLRFFCWSMLYDFAFASKAPQAVISRGCRCSRWCRRGLVVVKSASTSGHRRWSPAAPFSPHNSAASRQLEMPIAPTAKLLLLVSETVPQQPQRSVADPSSVMLCPAEESTSPPPVDPETYSKRCGGAAYFEMTRSRLAEKCLRCDCSDYFAA